ncbi:MAG: branched-chain-amino-acid transaminase [Candidatus Glassbacteria bacterium]|nr:branched-chain-amino-acid transaminase [Candidatus Glassbacteria bacterium]
MEPKVYIDGELYPKSQAKISVFDHGLLYGDGIFEGIRVYSGRIFRFREHIDRLFESAGALRLEMPVGREEMDRVVEDTVRANGFRDAYIRLVVTRGTGDLGIDPRKCNKSSLIVIVDKIQLYNQQLYEQGIPLVTASTRRIRPDMLNQRAKSLNYLNSIMAKMEAADAGVAEALMLDADGNVAECTADNIFVVKNGGLLTPATHFPILNGVTRRVVLELAAKLGIPAVEGTLTLHDIYTADECFLTGTGAELIPVISLDSRTIGDGKPGPVTARLLKKFRGLHATEGTDLFALE